MRIKRGKNGLQAVDGRRALSGSRQTGLTPIRGQAHPAPYLERMTYLRRSRGTTASDHSPAYLGDDDG